MLCDCVAPKTKRDLLANDIHRCVGRETNLQCDFNSALTSWQSNTRTIPTPNWLATSHCCGSEQEGENISLALEKVGSYAFTRGLVGQEDCNLPLEGK